MALSRKSLGTRLGRNEVVQSNENESWQETVCVRVDWILPVKRESQWDLANKRGQELQLSKFDRAWLKIVSFKLLFIVCQLSVKIFCWSKIKAQPLVVC